MKYFLCFYLMLVLLLIGCNKKLNNNSTFNYIPSLYIIDSSSIKSSKVSDEWHHKDILYDTIPGLSLDKLYDEILKTKKGNEVIVAILDMEVDINHEDLADNIWVNRNEIPNNSIDDDDNGYIDDVNGWNFLGNLKGENNLFVNYEHTRLIRKYDSLYKNKSIEDIKLSDRDKFNDYQRAIIDYKNKLESSLEKQQNYTKLHERYFSAKKALLNYFPNESMSLNALDSLENTISNENVKMQDHILTMYDCLKYNLTEEWIIDKKTRSDARINIMLNINYNDREITGDNAEDIKQCIYGTPTLNNNVKFLDHGTYTAGIIGANRNNKIGIRGVADNVKLMPLCIAAFGDENDKDIALAIRYAVDNGAKIINMSFSKEYSLHEEWVLNAIKYAEKNSVLIVTSAGNENLNLDKYLFNYPNDTDNNREELFSNFIKVGASGYNLLTKIKDKNSNYGKREVDLFAPSNILSTSPSLAKYKKFRGTSSSAPIVSGIAALIWSYYPELSVKQVKQVLMDSGISYNINVEVEQQDGTKKLVPFSELSKSGKIVNAYNALLMAEQLSKK